MATVLLTGFEPFDGAAVNPSWPAATSAAGQLDDAVAVLLPCVFDTVLAELRAALLTHRPELVVCVGQAGGRAELAVERVAVNLRDARSRTTPATSRWTCRSCRAARRRTSRRCR